MKNRKFYTKMLAIILTLLLAVLPGACAHQDAAVESSAAEAVALQEKLDQGAAVETPTTAPVSKPEGLAQDTVVETSTAAAAPRQEELTQGAAVETTTAATVFKQEELEQLCAPIALYPDSLVSQILMASTYPLEVVQADRWAKQNKDLKEEDLTKGLEAQTWDASVKSLVNFPQVLDMMNTNLDWTQKLGDAVLAQQKDVMATIQTMRQKAQAEGNLKSSEEQKVTVEEGTQTIIIESANPQVVYVPVYNPTVVYGAWGYPSYPPYYYYPPGYAYAGAAFTFTMGVAIGAAWGYAWGGCNWHNGDVDIDVDRNTNIDRGDSNRGDRGDSGNRGDRGNQASPKDRTGQAGSGKWQHDSSHRQGVPYADQKTSQKFNKASTADAAKSRESFRGRAESGRQDLSSSSRQSGSGASAGTSNRTGSSSSRSSAYGGVSSGSSARQSSSRGSSSRSSMSSSRGSSGRSMGGGSRGGGRR